MYLQFVFSIKNRQNLMPKEHKEELHKYLTGLVQNRNSEMLAVPCMPDHVPRRKM
ncbi:transposase [Dyadobacter aurulentus]|uniref:transposase n=1 Tax=Dyadobacter sp. UC 10 TaxID=2605428 RepID=UPI001CEDC0FE|nr:transposase [Dyadobacter sp. UC 10]